MAEDSADVRSRVVPFGLPNEAATRAGILRPNLLAILALGAGLRFRAAAVNDLSPDALGFLQKAQTYTFSRPWPAGEREPLWIALTKIVSAPLDYAPVAAKAMSLTASLALLVIVAAVSRLHAPPVAASVATAIIAVHPALVRDASNGIREPAVLLLLVLVGHWWLSGNTISAAVAAGVLVGVRWELGVLALVLLAVARIGWRPFIAGVSAAAFLTAPFLAANAHEYDDPLYHSSYHAKYYRNLEAAARAGVDPYSLDRYRGEPVSWSAYYLEYLGPAEAMDRVIRGWPVVVTAIAGGTASFPTALELRLGLAGVFLAGVAAIFSPERRLAVASVLLIAGGALGYAALYRLMEYRLVSFLAVPLAILLGLFADFVARRALDLSEACRNLNS